MSMKTALIPLLSLVLVGTSFAAPAPALSDFSGAYIGSATFFSSGTSGSGTGAAAFIGRQRSGKLVTTSSLNSSGSTIAITTVINFGARRFSYLFAPSTPAGSGSGRYRLSRNRISYMCVASFSGTPTTVRGTIRKVNNRLLIQESLSNGSFSAVFAYRLRK
jgi:hypothetical protein